MGKTNLLALFLIVMMVVVAAELLVNDYTSYPDLQNKIGVSEFAEGAQSNVFGGESDTNVESNIIDFNQDSLAPKSTSELNLNANPIQNSDENTVNPVIGFSVVGQVGLHNVVLQRVPFNGILFQRIDMRDFQSVPIIQQNVLQNNRDNIAGLYELHAESQLLANEVYLLIKEKAGSSIEAGVNETNELGNGSFYINYSDRPDTAFLVVKVRESVYAFVYKKELHTFVKSLILLL